MAGPAQMPSEKWIPEQLLLRRKSKPEWQRRQNDRNVHMTLVIDAEDVRGVRLNVLDSAYLKFDPRRPQNHSRPQPRAGVLYTSVSIEQRTDNRNRSHDGG